MRGRAQLVRRVAAAVGATLLAGAPAAAHAADRWFTVPLSVANSGPPESSPASWVGGGDEAAYFATGAALLPDQDTDNNVDIYKRAGAQLTLVSGDGPSGLGGATAVSADGSSVVFQTTDSLVPQDDDDEQSDLYETTDGVTRLVSVPDPNAPPSFLPFILSIVNISEDGRFVGFQTTGSLSSTDVDSRMDVYVWDRETGEATLASPGGLGIFDVTMLRGSMSTDGSHLFVITTDPLCCGDSGFANDVYDFDTTTGALSLASPGTSAAVTYGGISADGSHVYWKTGESLDSDDSDGGQVDVYEYAAGRTLLISAAAGFTPDAYDADYHGASADGSVVFFTTSEKLDDADDDNNADDIYKRTADGTVSLVSTGPAETFTDFGPIFSANSADGQHVFFYTPQDLSDDDDDGAALDAYDRHGSTTTRFSVGERNDQSFDDASYAGFSADVSRLFFQTSGDWDPADGDAFDDLYSRSGGHSALVTPTAPGGPCTLLPSVRCAPTPNGNSADGQRVWFSSDEALSPLDGDGEATDVYESRLAVPASVDTSATRLALGRGGAAESLDPGVRVADPYDEVFGATVHIAGGELGFTDQNGIAGSLDSAGETLTLTGRGSDADYETALRSVTYRSSNAGSRDVEFTVDNGAGPSVVATRGVDVFGPPRAPSGGGNATPPPVTKQLKLRIVDSLGRHAHLRPGGQFRLPGLHFGCPRKATSPCVANAVATRLGGGGADLAAGSVTLKPGGRSDALILRLTRAALGDLRGDGRLLLTAVTSFRSPGAVGAAKTTSFRVLARRR